MQANRPHTPEHLKEHRKRRRERVLIAITLVLVVAITSLEVHLVHQGGQPVTGSLLAFGLLNINTILLLLFTFLIFRHLAKLFLERRRKVFGSRLRTRLVLTFISLTLLPTLFLFFMAWQLISSRVDYSWDRQVEESLEQALDLSRTFSQEMEDKLKAYGRLFSLELKEQERLDRGDRESFQAFADRNRAAYQPQRPGGPGRPTGTRWPPATTPRPGKSARDCRRRSPGRLAHRRCGHPAEGAAAVNS